MARSVFTITTHLRLHIPRHPCYQHVNSLVVLKRHLFQPTIIGVDTCLAFCVGGEGGFMQQISKLQFAKVQLANSPFAQASVL